MVENIKVRKSGILGRYKSNVFLEACCQKVEWNQSDLILKNMSM